MEELQFGIGLHHLGAVVRCKAPREQSVGLAGEVIGEDRVREGKLVAGVEMVGVLLNVAARLPEVVVDEGHLAARDVRHQTFEYDAAGLILVEVLVEEIPNDAAALRDAESDRILETGCRERVLGVGPFVAQKRHDVAHGDEA